MIAAALAVPAAARLQAPAGPFSLAPLPPAFGANEAAIDGPTMELHWRFHDGAQMNNLNAAVARHSQAAALPPGPELHPVSLDTNLSEERPER